MELPTFPTPQPCAVVMWLRDGTVREEVFASRWQAEVYLAMIPVTVEQDGTHAVAAAMLSPLVGAGE